MPDDFDPYYTWLGIRPEETAGGRPDHYRLLGVLPLEQNREVISNATDQRMQFLRTLQVGRRAAASQALLNEIAAAGACLLDPPRKAEYDQRLGEELARRGKVTAIKLVQSQPTAALPMNTLPANEPPTSVLAVEDLLPPAALPVLAVAPARAPSGVNRARRSSHSMPSALVLVLTALAGFPLIGLIGVGLARLLEPPPSPEARRPPAVATEPPKHPPPLAQPQVATASPTVTLQQPPRDLPVTLAPDRPALPPGGIDLLKIDPQEVWTIRGALRRRGPAIETAEESTAFAIPVRFPREYRLEADVVRLAGKNSLCFGFRVQGRPLTAVIDGFDSKVSGLASVGGKEIFTLGNPLARPGAVLTNGRQSTVRIDVSLAAVELSVDGRSICRWENEPRTPLQSAQGMSWTKDEAVSVFAWDASYRLTRLVILPTER
jgi:hypothetical protein